MGKLSGILEVMKKHKKLLIVGAVVVTSAGIGVSVVNNVNQKKEQMMSMMNQTQTSQVERRNLVSSVSATGTVTSVNSKNVTANLSGMEVKSVSVEVGDMVEAGQVICVLDSEDIKEELADAKVALNVANEKTKMDLTVAERNLQDVLADYNIDLDRANRELLSYYQDYEDALKDMEEAKKEWDDAIQKTKDYKEEYDYQNNLLTNVENQQASTNSASTHSQEFTITKNMLLEYAKKNNVGLKNAVESRLIIGRDLSKITVGTSETDDFAIGHGSQSAQGGSAVSGQSEENLTDNETSNTGEGTDTGNTLEAVNNQDSEETDENLSTTNMTETVENGNGEESQNFESNTEEENAAIKSTINDYLSKLNSLSSKYNNANNLTENQSTLKQEVASWESKYKTAQQEESSAEKAYDQAVSALEASIEAYEKQLSNIEDTKKSGENSILSKSESLYSSQLNSLTSGDSEEKKIEQYQEQLQDCTVESPISGVITAVNVEAGDMYNGSAIVTIEDISGYEVSTEIDEYDIGKIEKGQKVIIKTNATGDEELEGTVVRIAPRASAGGSDVTYTVSISIDTDHEMLRMDMTAKLSIILESKENALTVPYDAVQEDENGKFYVEVVTNTASANQESEEVSQVPEAIEDKEMPQVANGANAGGRVKGNRKNTSGQDAGNTEITTKRVYVEKGIESDYYIEIISTEIAEGMEIVVPNSEKSGGLDIQGMMMRQGPMGGF